MTEIVPPPLAAAWGKAQRGQVPHPLACHILDTAAVARLVFPLLLGPRAQDELLTAFGALPDPVGWITFLAGVHDIGKYSPAFQALRSDLARELLAQGAADIELLDQVRASVRTDTPHNLITEIHMREQLRDWGAGGVTAGRISSALGAHHGHFATPARLRQTRGSINDHGGATWASWRRSMTDGLIDLLGLQRPTPAQWAQVRLSHRATVAFAALTSVSDWIASDAAKFPYAGTDVDLTAYAHTRPDAADKAVREVGWSNWRPPENTSYTALFEKEPRPVQQVVEQLAAGLDEPALLIIEAPTGEGKTNAMLQFAATAIRRRHLGGLYVAMPSKATSNQVHHDITTLLKRLDDSSALGLVYAGAADFLAARAAEKKAAADPSAVSADDLDDGDLQARTWFTRARNLLMGLGVGTVDQLMKAAFRSRHVFVRLAGLSNKVVVIDEMHAYDIYMSTLLDRLLMWLGHLGVTVVVMSATLPSRRRDQVVSAWQKGAGGRPDTSHGPETSRTYPRVTLAVANKTALPSGFEVDDVNKDRVVRLSHVPDDRVADWALQRARAGQSVAVIHNLVRRVTATHDALAEKIKALPEGERPALIYLTGPMPAKQRHTNEERLRAEFGPQGTRPRPTIVVGTQVLEQSLDLDFDAMITDLAPIDVLIQRAGRIHRHRRENRGPLELAITGVTDTGRGPQFPPHAKSVYQPWILLRTWALLRSRTVLTCPDDVQPLVDQVYGPAQDVACPAGWERAWAQAADKIRAAELHEEHRATTMFLPLPGSVQHAPELNERPKNPGMTRLSGRKRA
ncbi:CRISPR-associated helicase Cas3' [Kutzneria sp. NPDC052558]|uniref:CRISPR-associated helicase Cas3' n=1 Tax=Kutzneria sp. NPDC052558 TaxID=3364121 RepID=UPI0037C7F19E